MRVSAADLDLWHVCQLMCYSTSASTTLSRPQMFQLQDMWLLQLKKQLIVHDCCTNCCHTRLTSLLQDGSVYDYLFDQQSCDWVHWMQSVPSQELMPSLSFNEIIVQTIDTVRYSHLMRLLITHNHHNLFTGMTASWQAWPLHAGVHLQGNVCMRFLSPSCRANAALPSIASTASWWL